MLRVLTLSTLFPDASRPRFGTFVEAQVHALAARDGVEVQVVAPRGIPPLFARHSRYRALAALREREDWNGLTVRRPRFAHLPGTAGRFDAALLSRALLPTLRALRCEFAFDVIDASFFFPDGPAAVALGKAFGVPVSIKARGADIHHWGQTAATRRQIVAAGCAADGLLAVSAALRDDMAGLGMPTERIAVHHTGVDRARFHLRDRAAAKARLGIEGSLVVSIGALVPRKGHDIVIDAVAGLPGVQLAVIGDGPERAALERRAGDAVRFTGSLDGEAIADWLAAADAMALASASEGLANVWVEALASGTPVVTTDVGGAREILGREALAARTPEAFASAIAAVLRDPPPREAVAHAVEGFSWERNAEMLEAHLRRLVASHALGHNDAARV